MFAYWLVYIFNDPLNFSQYASPYFEIATLDAKIVDTESCTAFDLEAFKSNALYFLLWWGTHSGLARTKVKQILGIYEHPIERPLFAAIATVVWFLNVHNWKPISNCAKFDLFNIPPFQWVFVVPILLLATVLIVGEQNDILSNCQLQVVRN